jgi:hypothetical protein
MRDTILLHRVAHNIGLHLGKTHAHTQKIVQKLNMDVECA